MRNKAIVIFDNGGKTCDRYTGVITKTGDVIAFNDSPFHPSFGFGQYSGNICDRMNITFGYSWRKHLDENKVLKQELKHYLTEARNNPNWLGTEVNLSSMTDDVKKYIQQQLSE
jgi:hypothetical protein